MTVEYASPSHKYVYIHLNMYETNEHKWKILMYIMLLLILSNVFGDSDAEMNTPSHIYVMLCYAELM